MAISAAVANSTRHRRESGDDSDAFGTTLRASRGSGLPESEPSITSNSRGGRGASGLTVSIQDRGASNWRGTQRVSSLAFSSTSRRSTRARMSIVPSADGDDTAESNGLSTRDLIFFLFEGFPGPQFISEFPGWFAASDFLGKLNFLIVILSCMAFAVETLPEYHDRSLTSFFVIETFCIVFFTIDFIVRCALARERLAFFTSPLNWIDLVSILPFYIELAGVGGGASGLIMLRTLRLIRILRVLKLSKHNVGLEAVVEALQESSEAISLLGFLLLIALILFSSAMFFAEQTGQDFDEKRRVWLREGGLISPFQSIFHTMWWCIVTMTTVGYGDAYPITALGKIVGGVTMISGVFVLAFPTVILSTNFQEIHQAKVDAQKQLDEQAKQQTKKKQDDEGGAASPTPETGGIAAAAGLSAAASLSGSNKTPPKDTTPEGSPGVGSPQMTPPTSGLNSPRRFAKDTKDLPVCFTYSYRPYAQTTAKRNTGVKSKALETGIAEVMAKRENPTAATEDGEEVEVREVVVLDESTVVYNSVIHLQTDDSQNLSVKAEAHGSKTIVTLSLILESSDCQLAAESAVKELRPDLVESNAFVIPRPISKLRVGLTIDHPLLSGIRLLATTFHHPAGCVPLSLLVPVPSLLRTLLGNLSCIRISIAATYDAPVTIEEPLIHYGGVVLGGTSFEDDEEESHQRQLVEECKTLEQSNRGETGGPQAVGRGFNTNPNPNPHSVVRFNSVVEMGSAGDNDSQVNGSREDSTADSSNMGNNSSADTPADNGQPKVVVPDGSQRMSVLSADSGGTPHMTSHGTARFLKPETSTDETPTDDSHSGKPSGSEERGNGSNDSAAQLSTNSAGDDHGRTDSSACDSPAHPDLDEGSVPAPKPVIEEE